MINQFYFPFKPCIVRLEPTPSIFIFQQNKKINQKIKIELKGLKKMKTRFIKTRFECNKPQTLNK